MSHRGGRNYYTPRQQSGRGRGAGPGRNYDRAVPRPPAACSNFTRDGNCQYGQSCKYQHRIRRVACFERAHNDTIYCVAAAPLPGHPPGTFQIFTGGKDQCVKRWSITPISSSGQQRQPAAPVSSIPEGLLPSDALASPTASHHHQEVSDGLVFYDIKLENTTPFESSVTAVMLAAECLFCGLTNGKIRGFVSATGHSFDLVAHQKEVHALTLIDQILISGDFGGMLCFWQPGRDAEGRPTFNCVSTLRLANGITVLKEVTVPTPEGPVKTLWVGGVDRVYIIHLQTLSIASEIQLPKPPITNTKAEVCMELLPFGSSVLAGGVSGNIFQLANNGQGIENQSHSDEVMCMEGLLSDSGPMLVVGSREGWLNWLSLPSCQESVSLQGHKGNVRSVRVVDPSAYPGMPPAPPFIVSVSEDRAISLWTLSTSARRRPGTMIRQQQQPSGRGRGGRRY